MANYAVLNNTTIINIIVANSKEDAETVTNFTCVEIGDNFAYIGGSYKDGQFDCPLITPPELINLEE